MCKCFVVQLPDMGKCCDVKEGATERECTITVKVQCVPGDASCCADEKPADKPASGK